MGSATIILDQKRIDSVDRNKKGRLEYEGLAVTISKQVHRHIYGSEQLKGPLNK